MKITYQKLFTTNNYSLVTVKWMGVDHWVVPVTALVEGVHQGSGGPIFYPASELQDNPARWNGVPVPVRHPVNKQGQPLSANSPDVVEQFVIGRMWNTSFNDGKLKAEIWFDVNRTKEKAPEVYSQLLSLSPIEVSTGLWWDGDGKPGEWNGEKFNETATNFIPDHLAVLPDQKGACSYEDGCGIRFNQLSHSSIRDGLQGLIRGKINKGDYTWVYVAEVFDTFFIYDVEEPTGTVSFQQEYHKGKEDTIELIGDPKEVIRKTIYEPVTNTEEDSMKKCCPKKVDAIISSANTAWTEDDRAWLETQDEAVVDKLSANLEVTEPVVIPEGAIATINGQKQEYKAGVWVVYTEPVANTAPIPKTAEDFLANFEGPAEIKSVLSSGLAMQRQRKTDLVAAITANKRNKFTPEQLSGKSVEELEMLNELAGESSGDYSGRHPARNSAVATEEPMGTPMINFSK